MIKFLGKLPHTCTVAFSGGVDSVAVADFLLNGKRDVSLAFFNHGTKMSDEAEVFVKEFATVRRVKLSIGRVVRTRNSKESQEEFWRNERYGFLHSFKEAVVTAHHLDDAVETWIFNSIHGNPRILPTSYNNVIRPFLITPKLELIKWCEKKHLRWIEDASNLDVKYMRNLIRHKIVPEALAVNPGLRTVIRKKYLNLID
jgi:tRNA(Ile)-lysidine synthase